MAATGSSKAPVTSFLQERRRAMEGCRFKPENYYEISRVLGTQYAPDLNRVTSKHRADAASAYLRRLQRDVERSQGGYYGQLQSLPLQIKRLNVSKEDPRSFKSLLIPKLKLSPLPDATPSPRSVKSTHSPKMESPVNRNAGGGIGGVGAGGSGVQSQAAQSGTSFVPHKYFSPHSHTHIHVLFKQMPGQGLHKKGASSVISTDTSATGGGVSNNSSSSSISSSMSIITDSKASFKSKQTSLKNSKLLSPREAPNSRDEDDEEDAPADAVWPADTMPLPYNSPKFSSNQSQVPHIKKLMAAEKSPRNVADKNPRSVHKNHHNHNHHYHHNNHNNNHHHNNNNNSSRTTFRSPRLDHPPHPNAAPTARKTEETGAVLNSPREALPAEVASALAAASSISTLYRTKLLPQEMASAYDKNLPTVERQMVLTNRSAGRLPLPSIPRKGADDVVGDEMLAITSIQRSSAAPVQLAV